MRGLILALLAIPAAALARIACMNRGGDALPADAYPVPVSRVAELPALLAQHGRIQLDPAGDYRKATGITLRSGQAIFGIANTRIGRVVVVPGTSGAILSGVVPERLEFPPSRLVTHDNCFERFGARGIAQQPLVLRDAMVENNLFLDYGQLVVDTTAGGAVRNNRFIRTVVHGNSPALQLSGRAGGSDRNVFLWTNLLSVIGDGILVQGEAEANFVGFDAEDWNSRAMAATPAMLTTDAHGHAARLHGPGRGHEIATRLFHGSRCRARRTRRPQALSHGRAGRPRSRQRAGFHQHPRQRFPVAG
ncbi:MAG: hypothetical protein WDO12_09355 [Pseudomonadota bacterium]